LLGLAQGVEGAAEPDVGPSDLEKRKSV